MGMVSSRTDLHFRGAEFTTPNIDALAQSGVILDQYYVQARVMSEFFVSMIMLSSPSAPHPARR